MNPTEIYQFITSLIRNGAEVIAAAMMALGMGGFAGWKFSGWMSAEGLRDAPEGEGRERVRLLTERETVNRLTGELSLTKTELVTLRAEFRIVVEKEVHTRIEPIQGERDRARADLEARTRLSERYLRERNTAKVNAEDLQDQLTTREEAVKGLTDELTTTNEKLVAQVAQHQKSINLLLEKGRLLDDEKKSGLQLTRDLEKEQERGRILARDVETYRQTAEMWESKFTETENELVQKRQSLADERKKVQDLEEMIQAIQAQAGKIWERPVPQTSPRFVPLGEKRHCPIISLLNLKGGVGKTTLTLNLAATLSDRGKRVLMIDCDHQRSLSALCLPQQRRISLHKTQQTLQHFMRGPERSVQAFLGCVQELASIPTCASVINTASHDDEEGLASVEENLMLEWLFSQGNNDVRHALRAVLHSKEVAERFDYVFLDCPPRLSTATVNAIAASDYILIPVVLDATSASNPLPVLLRELRRLRATSLFPHFNILGVVANRVQKYGEKFVGNQWAVWEALPTPAAINWGEPVHRFQTIIAQGPAYGRAAKILLNDTQTAVAIWEDDTAKTLFSNLTDEIEKRINDEAPHLAAVHS